MSPINQRWGGDVAFFSPALRKHQFRGKSSHCMEKFTNAWRRKNAVQTIQTPTTFASPHWGYSLLSQDHRSAEAPVSIGADNKQMFGCWSGEICIKKETCGRMLVDNSSSGLRVEDATPPHPHRYPIFSSSSYQKDVCVIGFPSFKAFPAFALWIFFMSHLDDSIKAALRSSHACRLMRACLH